MWSLEKLDFKLIDMREVYEDVKSNKNLSFHDVGRCFPDPFSETGENHNLIGVANIGNIHYTRCVELSDRYVLEHEDLCGAFVVDGDRTCKTLC